MSIERARIEKMYPQSLESEKGWLNENFLNELPENRDEGLKMIVDNILKDENIILENETTENFIPAFRANYDLAYKNKSIIMFEKLTKNIRQQILSRQKGKEKIDRYYQ